MKTRFAITIILTSLVTLLVCAGAAQAGTFRFTASADNRPVQTENIPRWERLLDQITANVEDEGVFHIMSGDFDDPQTTDASLKTQFGSDVIWYPVTGNHEAETPSDMTWVRDAYESLPYIVNPGPTGCGTTTYSFDYGNAHFIAINEYYNGTTDIGADGDVVDALYDWLAADLAANTKPAVFVIGHEPAYPQFAHVGDSLDGHPANRDRFWKLLNDEKVIAYFCGHTHYYSGLQQAQTGDNPCDAFTWQIDCGNAGNPREAEQTFVDVVVTDTDVTFTTWQGTEGVAFTVRETWTVEIPSVVVASNPSPADAATGVSPVGLNLSATVHNPSRTTDPVDVEFFGREKSLFTIIAIGDTQNYTQSGTKAIYDSQIQWIVDNAASMNIVFVTHQGDIVNTWDNTAEWANAADSTSIIDPGLLNLADPTGLDPLIAYGVLPGNHDKEDVTNDSTYYNNTFPYDRYQGVVPWYGGHYGSTNNNNYQLFSAGGDHYVILHLEDWPDDGSPGPVIAWAKSILTAHSDRKAIITTHGYLTTSGGYAGKWGSTQYIRDNLVEAHDNVYFVLCGHSGEYAKTTTVGTREVHELLSCYHADGWLRIMTFDPDADEVHVQTYSPWLNQYQTDGNSDFVLSFDMTGASYSSIGSDLAVASGAIATMAWPSLAMETEYEWYVTVADTMSPAIAAGPLWDFTTASLKASSPDPANGAIDVDVDADLSWSAGVDAVSHDVYFGTDAGDLPRVSAEQAGTTYDPGTLQQGTTYYWAIDEHNSLGGITYGDVWSFTTAPPAPLTFQQGVNGYTGTADTMLLGKAATTNYAGATVITADGDDGGKPSHVLIRFDGVVGGTPGQIPVGSTILSATLRLRALDDGNGGKLHRLLLPWTATTITWANSFGGNGIQADDSEALIVEDDGVPSNSANTDVDLDVTATVQAWTGGVANNGWAILPNGTNGWDIASAEHATVDYRPELIVSFTPPQNQPAGNPNPADGATQVAVDADLSWTAGSGAVSHDVYFGTAQPPAFVQNQTGTTFDAGLLLPDTTYYWQIDERDSVGGVVTGAVWSFTTAAAPTQAGAPSPANGATGVSIDADLTWTAGGGTTSHQVYFGTDSDPRVNTAVNQAESTYNPAILSAATVYYWAIDEVGPGGTAAGEVWSFATAAAPGQANSPTPADAAGDVSVTAALSWMAGADATSHDVYLGTEAASLPQVSAGQTGTSYDPAGLESGTPYYWRVDETGPGGTTTGTVWSFTTGYPAPGQATNPNPPSPSSEVSADVVLSWTPGSDTTSHDVYFGTDTDPRENTPVNQTGAVFDPPGLLAPQTTFYWAIDEVGPGGTTSGQVWTFTTRANQAPTANAGIDQAVADSDGTGSETVTLNGSGSDADGTIASYEWKEGANILGNTAAITPDLAVGVHTITLTVTDNGAAKGSDDVMVTVNANQPPTANAGTDQMVSDSDGTGSETVTLNGLGSDTDGTIASYEWKEGANILGDTAAITPNLTVGVHTITLTVTDNGGATGSDDVIVTVNANQPPTANAGTDQTVTDSDYSGSESVTLSGSGADTDGSITAYQWTEGATPLGNAANISVDLAVGVHTVTLTVTDNGGAAGSDNVIVTVEEGPAAIDDTANSDIAVQGTITAGSYASTASSDNVYEAIREIRQGNTSTGKSLLEHKWTINVMGGSDVSFHVEAYRTANSEGDNFVFAYSTDNVTYTNLLTVTKTADDNTVQSAGLPSSLSGTVYVRVQDTDRTKGRTSLDTIYIDQMFVRSQGFGPDTSPPSPNPMTWAVAPYAASGTSVSMTATTASDLSGVEYYFACVAGGGHDSGWQAAPTYTDTGLTPGVEYTYQAKARDKSPNLNETAFSSPASATPSSVSAVFVTSIVKRPFVPAGKSVKAVAGVTINAPQTGGTVSADWYFKGALVQTGATGTTNAGGYTEIVSPPAKASAGDVFRFVVTNVTLTDYVYDPEQNVVSEIYITYP